MKNYRCSFNFEVIVTAENEQDAQEEAWEIFEQESPNIKIKAVEDEM